MKKRLDDDLAIYTQQRDQLVQPIDEVDNSTPSAQ